MCSFVLSVKALEDGASPKHGGVPPAFVQADLRRISAAICLVLGHLRWIPSGVRLVFMLFGNACEDLGGSFWALWVCSVARCRCLSGHNVLGLSTLTPTFLSPPCVVSHKERAISLPIYIPCAHFLGKWTLSLLASSWPSRRAKGLLCKPIARGIAVSSALLIVLCYHGLCKKPC